MTMPNITWVLSSATVSCVRSFRPSDVNHCIKHGEDLVNVANKLICCKPLSAWCNPTLPGMALSWKISPGLSLALMGTFIPTEFFSPLKNFFLEIRAWQHTSKMSHRGGSKPEHRRECSYPLAVAMWKKSWEVLRPLCTYSLYRSRIPISFLFSIYKSGDEVWAGFLLQSVRENWQPVKVYPTSSRWVSRFLLLSSQCIREDKRQAQGRHLTLRHLILRWTSIACYSLHLHLN